jgi:hypothetical protein
MVALLALLLAAMSSVVIGTSIGDWPHVAVHWRI